MASAEREFAAKVIALILVYLLVVLSVFNRWLAEHLERAMARPPSARKDHAWQR